MDDAALLSLSLGLTEAAFDGAPLKDPLSAISDAFGAEEVLLYVLGDRDRDTWSEVHTLRATPETLSAYRRVGRPRNPRGAIWATAPFEVGLDFDALLPAPPPIEEPLGALMRETGFPARHVCGIRVSPAPGVEARLSFGRNDRRGGFGSRTCAAMEALAPHLAAGLRARMVFAPAGGAPETFAPTAFSRDALEALPTPVALIEPGRRLAHANAALRSLAARNDGLALGPTRLHATDRAADAALEAAVDALLGDRTGRVGSPMRGIAVRRPSGAAPYLVQALALGSAARHAHGVMLLVNDLRPAPPDARTLRLLLGLTEAEAVLATLLADGRTLAEAAQARGIAHETARSQLKAVLGKTGCARQADLARLLARLGGTHPG